MKVNILVVEDIEHRSIHKHICRPGSKCEHKMIFKKLMIKPDVDNHPSENTLHTMFIIGIVIILRHSSGVRPRAGSWDVTASLTCAPKSAIVTDSDPVTSAAPSPGFAARRGAPCNSASDAHSGADVPGKRLAGWSEPGKWPVPAGIDRACWDRPCLLG